jgi:dihydroorotase-like cyclic amidohydrolase
MLPLLLTAAAEGRLPLSRLVRLLAERAAEVFPLPGKGRIAPGFDADLALVDLGAQWRFEPARSFSKARDTMQIHAGRRLRGRVVATLVRGVPVYREGTIVGEPGHGRLVRPPATA